MGARLPCALSDSCVPPHACTECETRHAQGQARGGHGRGGPQEASRSGDEEKEVRPGHPSAGAGRDPTRAQAGAETFRCGQGEEDQSKHRFHGGELRGLGAEGKVPQAAKETEVQGSHQGQPAHQRHLSQEARPLASNGRHAYDLSGLPLSGRGLQGHGCGVLQACSDHLEEEPRTQAHSGGDHKSRPLPSVAVHGQGGLRPPGCQRRWRHGQDEHRSGR